MYYDPLFSYYAVVNVRQNPRWIMQAREAYILRRDNIAMRPPGTYAEQVRIERNVTITRDITVVDHRTMGMSLNRLAADPIAGKNLRMVRVSEAERQQIRHQVAQLHQAREQRAHQEREAARAGVPNRPRTMSLPHSPIAAHAAPHPAAGHPGGHPASIRAVPVALVPTVARRGEGERESARGTEAHASRPAAEAPRAGAARRPAAKAARPAPAQRGRTTRPAESEERERRPFP